MGIIILFLLKIHYNTAHAEELLWILGPIRFIIEQVSTIRFDFVPYEGYVSRFSMITIAPACAGINFLLIAFATLFFPLINRFQKTSTRFLWLFICGAAAYLATLFANTIRILCAIWLYTTDIYNTWVTPSRVHRLEGTIVYLFILIALYFAATNIPNHILHTNEMKRSLLEKKKIASVSGYLVIPFFWYFLITIVVPFIRASGTERGPAFFEHIFFVSIVSGTVFSTCLVIRFFLRHRDSFKTR